MANSHGSAATLTINAGAITGFANDATLDRSVDTAETTVFGLAAKTYIPGLTDGTFNFSGFYDKTATTGSIFIMEAVLAGAAAVSCIYKPAGAASGNYVYTFNAILTQWTITGTVSDAVAISGALQITGAVAVTNP